MSTLTFETEEKPGDTMFLRTVLASGETADGTPFEISQAGVTLILSVGKFGPGRIVETIPFTNLAEAWLTAVGQKV